MGEACKLRGYSRGTSMTYPLKLWLWWHFLEINRVRPANIPYRHMLDTNKLVKIKQISHCSNVMYLEFTDFITALPSVSYEVTHKEFV